jgi:diguanylate cyclase (GGDEF)-like protein/PAS domain S-box-containing protein
MYLENFHARLDWRIPAVFLLVLMPLAHSNFVLFHTLVEGVAVIVAVMAFVVAFNTYPFSQSHYLMFLGCGYFWVGMLDLCHILAYPNMAVFGDIKADSTEQFWLLARLLEACVLMTFTLFTWQKIWRRLVFWSFGLLFALMFLMVYKGVLPTLFDIDTGLTPTKIVGEYLVMTILIVAGWRIWQQRGTLNKSILRLLLASIVLTIGAELSFTVYATSNLFLVSFGHILKLISYWVIYVALVESTLTQPFKSLSLSSDTFNALPDAIVVVDQDCHILHANTSARAFEKNTRNIVALTAHDVFHSELDSRSVCAVCEAIRQQKSGSVQELQVGSKWYEISLSTINYYGKDNVLLHVSRDITVSKEAQFNYQTANRLYTVLRLTNQAIISSKTKQDLLDSVCRIAVKHGGFAMAWIGMLEGPHVVPVSSMGDNTNYVKNVKVRIDEPNRSNGPVGIAIKGNVVACVNSIATDPCFAPWRDAAQARGYQSIAAVPVVQFGDCIGVFVIYSELFDAFDVQTLELLESLSDDISSVVVFIQAEEKRLAAEAKLRQLSLAIEQSKSAIVITDTQGNIEYINPYYTELTGYEDFDVVDKNMNDLPRLEATQKMLSECLEEVLNGIDWHGEVETVKKSGESFWSLQTVSPIVDKSGKITHIVWSAEDNTELRSAHETISQLAYFDALTGLPNRRLYHDRFKQAISAAKRHGTKLAIFYLDLDNFKVINDSWGHDFGDILLKHVADTLNDAVREMDTVARLGGDEFSIILNDVTDNSQAIRVADNILQRLNKKTVLDGRELTITTSIGVSLYPDDGDDGKTLMKHADMAMYHAKEKGKNNFQFFEEFLNIKAQQRLNMENKIERALKNNEFQLFYQPQFDIHSEQLSGVEALIRWPDGKGGFTPPIEFIPIAEETALIIEIGNWVVSQACHEFKSLIDQGFPRVNVAVNISASQFRQARGLLEIIDTSLKSSGLPNHLLELELTEGILIEDVNETISVMDKLKQQNITFAIDDFGTGYSSLSYLKSFPADILKIDRSFVRDIENDLNDQAIIRAISVMAHELDLKVLAEGVENKQQLEFLRAHHCDFIQGFYLAKPMAAQDLLAEYGVKL